MTDPVDTATLTERVETALAIGRALAVAIANAISDEPHAHLLAAEVAAAKEPYDVAIVSVRDLAAHASSLETRLEEADRERDDAIAEWKRRGDIMVERNELAQRLDDSIATQLDILTVKSKAEARALAAEAREKALSEGIRRLLAHFVSPEEDVIPDVAFARAALVDVRGEEKEQDKPKEESDDTGS